MSGQATAALKAPAWACAVLAGGLHLSAAASAQTAEAPPASPPPAAAPTEAPQPSALKGAAAWQQLVGNTVVAQGRGGGYTEYYAADGAVQHLDSDGKSSGKWSVEGDKICFDFPEEDDRSCVEVESDGKTGTFTDEDKSRDTFTVLPGDAKHL